MEYRIRNCTYCDIVIVGKISWSHRIVRMSVHHFVFLKMCLSTIVHFSVLKWIASAHFILQAAHWAWSSEQNTSTHTYTHTVCPQAFLILSEKSNRIITPKKKNICVVTLPSKSVSVSVLLSNILCGSQQKEHQHSFYYWTLTYCPVSTLKSKLHPVSYETALHTADHHKVS